MESDFIEWLRARIPAHPLLRLGPGDDAALLRLAAGADAVVTSDLLTDGVDFQLEQCDAKRVGRKSLAVNLSDLAAMAARPVAAIVSLALPRTHAAPLARELYHGLMPLAEQFNVAIAGGDTNTWNGQLVICITAVGLTTARGPLRRDRAQPGDSILVTGRFGGSILGRHFDFVPRVRESLLLHERYEIHAGIDVSDGLSLDVSRLASASRCGVALKLDCVPIDPAAHELSARDPASGTALDHALADGEDFELVLAAPPAAADKMLADQPLDVPLTRIGHIVPQTGLWQVNPDQTLTALPARGFQHE